MTKSGILNEREYICYLGMVKSNSASLIFPLNLDRTDEHTESDTTVPIVSRLVIRSSFLLVTHRNSEETILSNQ